MYIRYMTCTSPYQHIKTKTKYIILYFSFFDNVFCCNFRVAVNVKRMSNCINTDSPNQNNFIAGRINHNPSVSKHSSIDKKLDDHLMHQVKKFTLLTNFKQVDGLLICDAKYDCPWNTQQ